MSKRYVYDHGLPFNQKLGESIEDAYKRVQMNKASLIIIDGGIGEGKTTLLVQVLDYINKLNGMNEIKLTDKHPQLGMGGKDFLSKLRICYHKKLPGVGYDEAGDFNRRGSLTRFNAMINRTFETFRAFKIIVVLALPSFHVLDQDLFDKNIPRLLVHLKDRNEGYGNFQGYSLYRMLYLKARMQKLIVKSFAYDFVEPNFRGQFLDLTPSRSKQLDNISTHGKIKALKGAEIEIEGLMGYTQLAQRSGRNIRWVRDAVNILKIRENKTIGRTKYFDESVLNRLMDYMDNSTIRRGKR